MKKDPNRKVPRGYIFALREQNDLISPSVALIAGEIGRVRGAGQKLRIETLLQEIGKISRASLEIGVLLEEWEKRRS